MIFIKKILVSDYDNTFYLNDKDIEKNKEAVNKFRNKGNIFVIATGRSYYDFCKVSNLYNISYDYVIINHGASILDKNGNILSNFSIDNNIIKNIQVDLQTDKSTKLFCCSKLESRVNFDYKNITKINIHYNTTEQANTIMNLINNKYSNYVKCYAINNYALEIISNKTNKSHAISILANMLNITKDNIYTIGDALNDIEMIRDFNGYAINNAVNEVKLVAQQCYESVSKLVIEITENNNLNML